MSFMDMSGRRLQEFKDHLVAQEPFLLRELAVWMRDTGGPLDAMDGSYVSLEQLWAWYLEQLLADLPGISRGVRPSLWDPVLDDIGWLENQIRDQSAGEELERYTRVRSLMETGMHRRLSYSVEPLIHYLRVVLAQIIPTAAWEIFIFEGKRKRDPIRLLVAISVGKYGLISGLDLANIANDAYFGDDEARSPEYWLRRVVAHLDLADAPPQERSVSLLTPYLTADLGPLTAEALISPAWTWPWGWSLPDFNDEMYTKDTPEDAAMLAGDGNSAELDDD